MENVLVTGGAGFVGSYLVESVLKLGCRVTVLDNFADAPSSNLAAFERELELVRADVRDERWPEQIGPIDTIFHLAANASVPRSAEQPVYDATVNIVGTINALRLARERNARFFLASSGAVYGEPVSPPMREDHPLEPISPYGASKLGAEQYVELYKRLYGVSATIIRFFNMYGPRQRRFVVYDFARKILAPGDEVVILGDGRQIRSQLYVEDAIRAVLTVARHGEAPVYNVGSARNLTVTEIMAKMLDAFGTDKKLTTSQSSWHGDVQRLVPDVSALQTLGWREEITYEQGLLHFKEWFLAAEGAPSAR